MPIELKTLFPEAAPAEVPGPMIPIYRNIQQAAAAFANVLDTSAGDHSASIELVVSAFGAAVETINKWKP